MAVALAAARNPGALATPAARRQDPRPPFPYDEVEAAIVSGADGSRLEGALTLPRGEGRFPAVLLLSGAGAQDRGYSALGHRFFLVLADHLTRQGIAGLRLDDRGAGRSGRDSGRATIAEAVGDVQAGVARLGHPDATVRVLPGLNHFLQHARNGLPAEIPEIDETMAPEALDAIADWVVRRFGGSS